MPTDPVIEATGFGAAITPEEWASYVLANLSASSVALVSGATEIRTTAKAIHVPRITAFGNVGWYGELDPIATSGPDGDELVFSS